MNDVARDRGTIVVLTLAVVTAMGLTVAALLEGTMAVLRREQAAWSSAVALADTISAETWWLGELRAQPTMTCDELLARSPPPLSNGSVIAVECHGGPPLAWSVTVSAIHGPRRAIIALAASPAGDGSLTLHRRSLVTEPSPAFTNEA
jgi:hypothetical protein